MVAGYSLSIEKGDYMLNVEFWQGRYDSGQMHWDLGAASPHFAELLARRPEFLKPGKMAVLGSGQGHDAALFANAGFDVTGFDYAPGAIERADRLYGDQIRFVQADIFELAAPESPWTGQFDYVLEHTCFCAILPKDRPRYVHTAASLLKPGGYLLGVFWEHGEDEGPPFNTTEAELREAFSENFELVSMAPLKPAANRAGIERLVIFRRNPSGS
jgi:SAM-dependent methyltransferase